MKLEDIDAAMKVRNRRCLYQSVLDQLRNAEIVTRLDISWRQDGTDELALVRGGATKGVTALASMGLVPELQRFLLVALMDWLHSQIGLAENELRALGFDIPEDKAADTPIFLDEPETGRSRGTG